MRAAQLPSGDGGGGGGGDARPDGSKGRDGAFKGCYVAAKTWQIESCCGASLDFKISA